MLVALTLALGCAQPRSLPAGFDTGDPDAASVPVGNMADLPAVVGQGPPPASMVQALPDRPVIIGAGLAGLAAAMDLPGSLLLESLRSRLADISGGWTSSRPPAPGRRSPAPKR